MELTAHFDNSANSKYNPDPAKAIRWGEQSWDEMIFAWVAWWCREMPIRPR